MLHIKEQHFQVEVVEIRKDYLFFKGLLVVKFSFMFYFMFCRGFLKAAYIL